MKQRLSGKRRAYATTMKILMGIAAGMTAALVLFLIIYVLSKGLPNLSWQLLSTAPSYLSGTIGIWPDILVCRSEHPLDNHLKDKIALFCNVPSSHVLQNLDVEYLYEAPLAMEKEHLAQVACECLHLPCPEPDLTDWTSMVEALRHPTSKVHIAIVGKYIQLHDAYISVVEALKHGGIASHSVVDLKWVDSELVNDANAAEYLSDVDGILVPGGFGDRGIELSKRQDRSR